MKPIKDPELYIGMCKIEGFLEEKGWIQDESRTSDGHCLLDAISRTSGSIYDRIRDAIYFAIIEETPRHGRSACLAIVRFNDAPETTFDDVRRVLRKARESAV